MFAKSVKSTKTNIISFKNEERIEILTKLILYRHLAKRITNSQILAMAYYPVKMRICQFQSPYRIWTNKCVMPISSHRGWQI